MGEISRHCCGATRSLLRSLVMKRSRGHVTVERDEGVAMGPPFFPQVLAKDVPKNAPKDFMATWNAIFAYRDANQTAPVDSMGCERLFEKGVPPKEQRYHVLVSLMLSPQSKDEKTAESMRNLWAHGPLTP